MVASPAPPNDHFFCRNIRTSKRSAPRGDYIQVWHPPPPLGVYKYQPAYSAFMRPPRLTPPLGLTAHPPGPSLVGFPPTEQGIASDRVGSHCCNRICIPRQHICSRRQLCIATHPTRHTAQQWKGARRQMKGSCTRPQQPFQLQEIQQFYSIAAFASLCKEKQFCCESSSKGACLELCPDTPKEMVGQCIRGFFRLRTWESAQNFG